MSVPIRRRRGGRLGLYGPFAALLLLALAWSAAWFVIRGRVVAGLDEWIAAEANAGRRWTCADRAVGGYPFRIEIACGSLALERPDVSAALGRLLIVAQIYAPSHVIAEAAGPLRVQAGPTIVDATWRALQASVVTSPGQQRAALVADGSVVRVAGPSVGDVAVSSRRLELHARPDPADAGTADLALSAQGAVIPGLDVMVGGTEPADIDLVVAVTRAYDLPARPLWAELERWRAAGGRVQASRIVLAKGARRIEAKASFAIDEAHRPQGEVGASAIGIEGLLGRYFGDRGGLAAGLLGALLGAPSANAPKAPEPGAKPLRPLPPLRIDAGRLMVGPLAVPGVRVPALY